MMDKDKADMTKEKVESASAFSSVVPIFKLEKDSGVFRIPVSDKWTLAGKTQVKIRSSRTTLCILGLLITLIATGVVLNCRIHKLESKNLALDGELTSLNLKLMCLMTKIFDSPENGGGGGETNEACSEWEEELIQLSLSNQDKNHENYGEEEPTVIRTKRVRKSLEYQNQNRHGSSESPGNVMPVSNLINMNWNSSAPSPLSVRDGHRKRERGTKSSLLKEFRNLKHLRKKDKIDLAKLKIKLESAKKRAKTVKSLLTAYRERDQNARNDTDARAVYLTVRDTNINIMHPKQRLGPWYMSDAPGSLAFNDLWYQKLSLDENGTSVMFQENGLYLIYAQVYYKSTQTKKDKVSPMGFRIYLKKNIKIAQAFKQPIPIAECVPAFPKTFYQTCFTQICWFVEEGDEIYLEHFTDATPVIEAEKMGQTFLGIVRL